MRVHLRHILWLGCCLLVSRCPVSAQADRFTRVTKQLITAMNADDQAAIQAMFTPEMQKALPADKSSEFFRGLVQAAGKVTKIGEPNLTGNTAQVRLTCERGAWDMKLSLDVQDRIAGLYFTSPVPEIPVPERNTVPLRLPLREEWTIFWGGATEAQNYHVNTRNQRRALDIVIRNAQGQSHRGDGQHNEDYYCFGKEILAAGSGTVVMAIDGVPENTPGSMNPYSAVGNCIMIRHADHEFSVYAHHQPHSLRVTVGDKVQAGQLIGLCGNTGNSSEPHLHFHLQNTAMLQDGTGFAPYFHNVHVVHDGHASVEREYTPVRDDRVRQEQTMVK